MEVGKKILASTYDFKAIHLLVAEIDAQCLPWLPEMIINTPHQYHCKINFL